ncbi:MAG: ABC transporter ATP-binding protein [Actinobacteria bacterium]|nr:ABC transporter ATP-binding protein [Actinomycetota bacterium]
MSIASELAVPVVLRAVPPAIHLSGVSVRYRVPRERVLSIKEFAIRWLQGRIEYQDLWGLRSVDLDIEPGEIVGIVGRNGAGKTTLLKTVAQVLHPTEGRVVVRGRTAALLDLSAGFHPELTGRENVYLFGTLLGFARRQIDAAFDEIVDFAELESFIDSPIRAYSSGMVARLGFAVATCRFAEVLLVDEVLAVGDARFQEKCLERMRDYRRQGATTLLVSHSAGSVSSVCDRAVWLEHGRIRLVGPAAAVCAAYAAA